MASTIKNSRMTDEWIAKQVAANPCKPYIDPKTGQPNGILLTCPVRLAFCNLFTAVTGKNDNGSDKAPMFNATLLFPPQAQASVDSVLWPAAYNELVKTFPDYVMADGNLAPGLHIPFHDQAEKAMKYSGYTPGASYINVSSQFKPPVVDAGMNPVVDENAIYAGCWAIVALNVYAYKNRKKGVAFGLQTVMKIADDEKLSGGGADPTKTFAGVQVDASFDAAKQFGAAAPIGPRVPPRPPGAAVMPPAQPVSAAPSADDYM